MSGKSLKVTDRRMFTADGQLREEYRDLEEKPASSVAEPSPREARSEPAAPGRSVPAQPPPAARHGDKPRGDKPPGDQPAGEQAAPEAEGAPGFMDLVGLLAEPAMIYLRQAHGADPRTANESLELARLHIDLLAVLRAKTEGNLTSAEQAMLDDVNRQLRSGYLGMRR